MVSTMLCKGSMLVEDTLTNSKNSTLQRIQLATHKNELAPNSPTFPKSNQTISKNTFFEAKRFTNQNWTHGIWVHVYLQTLSMVNAHLLPHYCPSSVISYPLWCNLHQSWFHECSLQEHSLFTKKYDSIQWWCTSGPTSERLGATGGDKFFIYSSIYQHFHIIRKETHLETPNQVVFQPHNDNDLCLSFLIGFEIFFMFILILFHGNL